MMIQPKSSETVAKPSTLRNRKNKIKIRRWTNSRRMVYLVFISLLVCTVYILITIEHGNIILRTGNE